MKKHSQKTVNETEGAQSAGSKLWNSDTPKVGDKREYVYRDEAVHKTFAESKAEFLKDKANLTARNGQTVTVVETRKDDFVPGVEAKVRFEDGFETWVTKAELSLPLVWMTVGGLIEQLSKYPLGTNVWVTLNDDEDTISPLAEVEFQEGSDRDESLKDGPDPSDAVVLKALG